MADEQILCAKSVSYGTIQLVKSFSFPGTIQYWIKVNGELKGGYFTNEGDALAKFNSY